MKTVSEYEKPGTNEPEVYHVIYGRNTRSVSVEATSYAYDERSELFEFYGADGEVLLAVSHLEYVEHSDAPLATAIRRELTVLTDFLDENTELGAVAPLAAPHAAIDLITELATELERLASFLGNTYSSQIRPGETAAATAIRLLKLANANGGSTR